MCLVISIEVRHDDRDLLVKAAAVASRIGLKVEVVQSSWWRTLRSQPISAKITEDGSCSCSLLADDADWNAATWALRADVVPAVVATLESLLSVGPSVVRISALWAGHKPEHVRDISAKNFIESVSNEGLGTKTTYVVATAV